jgi:hypothetical protein
MVSFPYKPRRPRVPPEAPEPETPQNSDWRLYGAMLRIAFTALFLVGARAVLISRGAARDFTAIGLLVLSIVCAAVPQLRALARRGWHWYRPGFWWWDEGGDR